jgi:hypothetical protein
MNATGEFLIVVCIILAIWDLISELRGGVKSTESWFINRTAKRFPTLVFALGFLCGHFLAAMGS